LKPVAQCLQITALFLSLLATDLAQAAREPAAINRSIFAIVSPSKRFYDKPYAVISPEMLVSFKQIHDSEAVVDTSKFIPTNLQPTQNAELVLSQIVDRSLNFWWNTSQVQSSIVGQNLSQFEKSVHQEFVMKQSRIEHKFALSFDALQAKAHLKYSGLISAEISYAAKNSSVALESTTKIDNKDLFLSQRLSQTDQSSELGVRWTF
jgi:hypothetical protein